MKERDAGSETVKRRTYMRWEQETEMWRSRKGRMGHGREG